MGSDDRGDDRDDVVVDAVLAFLNAGNEVAGRQVLRERAEALFSDLAESVFAKVLWQYQAEPDTLRHIGQQRQRLEDARAGGVEAAYAEVLTPAYAASLEKAFAQLPVEAEERIGIGSALLVLADEAGNAPRCKALRHEVGCSLARAALRTSTSQSRPWLETACEWIDRSTSPAEWARAHHNLGELLRQLPDEPEAIEHAIHCFDRALEVFTPESAPVDCGLALNSLGGAWLNRREGSRAQNIEQGISRLQAALALRPRERFPAFWCKTHLNLGTAYASRQLGDKPANAAAAIHHLEASMAPESAGLDLPLRVHARKLLATQLARRAAEAPDAGDARRAIDIADQALADIGASDHAGIAPADIASLHTLVADVLEQGTAGERDAERALARYQAAIDAADGDPAWQHGQAMAEQTMGRLYEFRQAGDRVENLKAAIAHYERAAAACERRGLAEVAAACRYWAGEAWSKRRDVQRHEAWQQAVDRLRAALAQYPSEAPASLRISMHVALADALGELAAGDRGQRIEEAIVHYEAAIGAMLPGPPPRDDWIRAHSGLGIALLERPQGERADNLERAIAHQREVLAICTREDDPREWALAHHNLGNVHAVRPLGSRRDNLEEAIRCFEAALSAWDREEAPQDWAMSQNSCAGALVARIAGDRADNVERALARYGQALSVCTREAHPQDWAMTRHNLALAYLQRVEGDRDLNVEHAIDALTASLEIRTRESLPCFWAMTQANLGNAWQQRQVGDRPANARRAVDHFRLAQQVYTREAYPDDWAWIEMSLGASALLPRAEDRIACLENALQVCTRERQPERWALGRLALGQACAERDAEAPGMSADAVAHFEAALQGLDALGQPAHRADALSGLGDARMKGGEWAQALALYDEAISLGEEAFEAACTAGGLLAATSALVLPHRQSAWCLWRLGRCADALLRIEAGRTRLLRLDLARNDTDLATLPDDLRQRVRDARHTVRVLAAESRESDADAPPPVPVDWRRLEAQFPNARREDDAEGGATLWSVPLHEARAVMSSLGLDIDVAARLRDARTALREAEAAAFDARPGLRPPAFDEAQLVGLVPPGGALVAFMLASDGAVAWVLPDGAARVEASHALVLPDDTLVRLQEHMDGSEIEPGWVQLLGGLARGDGADPAAHDAGIEQRTGQLWTLLMAPVQARLEALGLGTDTPVLLVPHGALALLPLHAAWREVDGRPRAFLDDHVVTFSPGFVAAQTARARAAEPARQARSLLAVGDPTGDLPHAREECAAAAGCFDEAASARCLIGPQATEAAVEGALRGAAYVHFATHGHYSGHDVMRSHLRLADGGRLSLARVVSPGFDLSAARLVVLSACDSGLSEAARTPDEFLGLPGGFLEGRAAGVVSALWSVNDASTARLFGFFYRDHLGGGLPVAAALRAAQRQLRDATVESLGLAQTWEAAYLASRLGDGPDPHAYGMMRWCRAHPQARPYASPSHWAAFVFNGG